MSIDISWLKKNGCSSGSYKPLFSADAGQRPAKVNKLIELIASRVQEGRANNLRDYRVFWAIDLACEEPVKQIKPTLLANFLSQKWKTPDEAYKNIESWGLLETDAFIDVKLEGGFTGKMLDPKALAMSVFPIVMAYVKARLSKIFNERNTNPLLPCNPLKMTEQNEVICEIVTDVFQTVASWLGYPVVLHDAIQQMLKYGVCLAFPREEWYCETQVRDNGTEKGEKFTVKEGIRYVFPHPTQMFWDLMYPLTSLNTDTGCTYAGHWQIRRYGDILDNPDYWNRKSIPYGSEWTNSSLAKNYFAEVYPCQLQFPISDSFGSGGKREDRAANYSSAERDKALFTAEVYFKLKPSDWGLGEYEMDAKGNFKKLIKTYKHEVWHRFTLAADATIIWAEPCAYTPPWFMGYDFDPNAAVNSSLALECIPTQDQVGNLVTQMLLTSKNNLMNVIFYDHNIVDKSDIEKLQGMGDRKLMGPQFIAFDALKNIRAGVQSSQAFQSPQFPFKDIQQQLQMITTHLNLLERTLQITAQETGGTASHQQSKAEIVQLGGASSNRLNYTASFVDEGVDAWKRQLFQGWRAYGDSGVLAQVSSDIKDLEKHLTSIGFKVKNRGEKKVLVEGTKKTLNIEGFARSNEGPQMAENKEASQVLLQTIGTISAQPDLMKQIGVKNIVAILQYAARLGGAPRGFKLPLDTTSKNDQGVTEAVVQAIQAAQQATLQAVADKIAKPAAEQIAQDQKEISEIQAMLQKYEGIFKMAQANAEKTAIKAQETQQKMQQDAQEFQAQMRRDEETHALKMKTLVEEAQVEFGIKKAEAATDIQISQAKAVAAAKSGRDSES